MKLKHLLIVFFFVLLGSLFLSYRFLDYSFGNCLNHDVKLKIYPGDNVDSLVMKLGDAIDNQKFLSYYNSFSNSSLREGYYVLKSGTSERYLLRIVSAGFQTPVKVVFNNVSTLESLAGKISRCLLVDSVTLLTYFQDSDTWEKYSLTKETFPVIFLPDTYEMYWTDTPEKFVSRMASEYQKFWNDERTAKAKTLGFSPLEISTIASIVDKETIYAPDRTKIAGVYINRLRAGMPLQADPTVKYAVGNPSLRRVLNKHLAVDSPYNTYKYAGLPPGPICMPNGNVIDAVLAYNGHKYYYFCAAADMSGRSEFSENLSQHSKYARAYQNKLNKMKIY